MIESLSYAAIINLVGLLIMKVDKRRAQQRKWRVPERYIWLISLLGGALGTLIGMHYYRHKTKHLQFRIGLPLIIIIYIIGLSMLYWP